jgi:methyl coenzyme M reductase subunit D
MQAKERKITKTKPTISDQCNFVENVAAVGCRLLNETFGNKRLQRRCKHLQQQHL